MEYPKYIINELGVKMIPFKGEDIEYLKSLLYTENNYPVRILVDEGGEYFTCGFVVYITDKNFICVDTSSLGENFQGIFKIGVDNFKEQSYNNYRIYVKEL